MELDRATTLWKFIRGDLSAPAFETWLYAQDDLEPIVGEPLYFDLISADYRNRDDIFDMRSKLSTLLRPTLVCECVTLPDLAVVPMGAAGLDERVFATIDDVLWHGRGLWWLYLARCRCCAQNWMIAQDTRIYDNHFFKRLSPDEAHGIVNSDLWPQDFLTYERALQTGRQLSRACRFVDPMAWSLIDSVHDLQRDRPTITITEIASLLGIDVEHANALLSFG